MKILRHLAEMGLFRGGAVAIGNFDGVHKGHARIVEQLRAEAQRVHGPAVIFTFDPHPVRLLRPQQAPPPLTWTDRKGELLARLGVDAMLAYPTDEALLALSPEAFFQKVVHEGLAAKALVEGTNFYFGHRRAGNVARLAELATAAAITLEVVPPLELEGEVVSSSRIRELLAHGDVATASTLLTAPYRLRGLVVHGAGRGARLGFGTANLEGVDTMIPAVGVYAGACELDDKAWPAAIHIGPNPTFGENARKIEVHLVGWSEPLYGKTLEVDILQRLREVTKFATIEALLAQLHADVQQATAVFTNRFPTS
jgi:riboflavin kinase/FMN adenylyltransferase